MIDLEIRQFKDELITFVNKYELPLEVKRLVFGEIYSQITEASNAFILQQKQELENKANKEEQHG